MKHLSNLFVKTLKPTRPYIAVSSAVPFFALVVVFAEISKDPSLNSIPMPNPSDFVILLSKSDRSFFTKETTPSYTSLSLVPVDIKT